MRSQAGWHSRRTAFGGSPSTSTSWSIVRGSGTIHAKLEGLGYVPPFSGSKNLRDAEHGVRIEFLIAGEFPGDGKPKPVAFPDPDDVGVEIDGDPISFSCPDSSSSSSLRE